MDVLTTDLYREGCSAQEEDYTRFYNETRQSLEFGDFGVELPGKKTVAVTKSAHYVLVDWGQFVINRLYVYCA